MGIFNGVGFELLLLFYMVWMLKFVFFLLEVNLKGFFVLFIVFVFVEFVFCFGWFGIVLGIVKCCWFVGLLLGIFDLGLWFFLLFLMLFFLELLEIDSIEG